MRDGVDLCWCVGVEEEEVDLIEFETDFVLDRERGVEAVVVEEEEGMTSSTTLQSER